MKERVSGRFYATDLVNKNTLAEFVYIKKRRKKRKSGKKKEKKTRWLTFYSVGEVGREKKNSLFFLGGERG
jgi:hypothetical protein